MQIIDRLKMELSNQEYFSDEQYTQFLLENGLPATAEYNKETDQRQMLLSALDILEAVSNDIDIMCYYANEIMRILFKNIIKN